MLEVVAGVLRDAGGRVLLAQRGHGRDLAGLWEFPGGKREPGETPQQALCRELHEELGVTVDAAALRPLIAVAQATASRRLRLDVHDVTAFAGMPQGREGQALVWVAVSELARFAMPPADLPVAAALRDPDTCVITPDLDDDSDGFLRRCQQVLLSGVHRIQLRTPSASTERRASVARELLSLCRVAEAELWINADIALAKSLGCGLHLRSTQLREFADKATHLTMPLAASCHDATELQLAKALGVRFAVLGPVQPTATHPNAPVLGWDGFAALREQVDLPLYALGGLAPRDLSVARRHGAQGIAGIRAYWPGAY